MLVTSIFTCSSAFCFPHEQIWSQMIFPSSFRPINSWAYCFFLFFLLYTSMASFTQSKSSCMFCHKTLLFFMCWEKAGKIISCNSVKPASLFFSINDLINKSHKKAESKESSSTFVLKTVLEADASSSSSCFAGRWHPVHCKIGINLG